MILNLFQKIFRHTQTSVYVAHCMRLDPLTPWNVASSSTPSPQAARLALEGDQKRVTPLHLTCALYSTTADTGQKTWRYGEWR